jgi:hypothetical protein
MFIKRVPGVQRASDEVDDGQRRVLRVQAVLQPQESAKRGIDVMILKIFLLKICYLDSKYCHFMPEK